MKLYRLTAEARRDVQLIWSHVAEDSPAAASRLVNGITDKFAFLGRNPAAGRRRDEVRRGYRSFPQGEYLIFYRISPPGVQIVRVVHGRRDLPRLLN